MVAVATFILKGGTEMVNILTSRSILGEPHVRKHLTNYIKNDMKVAIIAFSFFAPMDEKDYFDYYGKNGEYYIKMLEMFKTYDIDEKNIHFVYYYKMSAKESLNIIKDADILYFPGGAPDQMMARIKEKGLLETIEAHDKIFAGSSAGAMIQFKNFHISIDDDYKTFSLNEGLHMIDDFIIEVHYKKKRRQKRAMKRMHRMTKKDIYTLPDDGVIIYTEGKVLPLFSARKHYDKKGIYKG